MSNIPITDEIKDIYSKVKWILESYPAAREDDNFLVEQYWYNWERDLLYFVQGRYVINLFEYNKLTSPSVIERVRRKIQEDAIQSNDLQKMKLYLPKDDKVMVRRRIHSEKWREYIREYKKGQGNLWDENL